MGTRSCSLVVYSKTVEVRKRVCSMLARTLQARAVCPERLLVMELSYHQPTMPRLNRSLVRIFRACFLQDFANPLLGPYTPFWWPLHPATEIWQWGLRQGEEKILESLGPATRVDTGYPNPHLHALGSLGAKRGCIWCVTFRPSPSRKYLHYYWKPYKELLMVAPKDIVGNLDRLTIHVTDPVKYRGPTNNTKRLEGMQSWMWEKSVRCLRMEYEALRPRCVLLSDLASSWFEGRYCKPGKAGLHYESVDRRAWRAHPTKRKLDTFLSKLQEEGIPENRWTEALLKITAPGGSPGI